MVTRPHNVIYVILALLVIIAVALTVILYISWYHGDPIVDAVIGYSRQIAESTNGFTLIKMNVSFYDMYNGEKQYYMVIEVDNNYCQPFIGVELYYNNTLIFEYYRRPGFEDYRVYNRTLLEHFVNTYLKGYDRYW